MNMEEIKSNANEFLQIVNNWATSPIFYTQAACIVSANMGSLKKHNIEIPFPQRQVRIIEE